MAGIKGCTLNSVSGRSRSRRAATTRGRAWVRIKARSARAEGLQARRTFSAARSRRRSPQQPVLGEDRSSKNAPSGGGMGPLRRDDRIHHWMVGRQALEIEFLKGALKNAPRPRSVNTSVICRWVIIIIPGFTSRAPGWRSASTRACVGELRRERPPGHRGRGRVRIRALLGRVQCEQRAVGVTPKRKAEPKQHEKARRCCTSRAVSMC